MDVATRQITKFYNRRLRRFGITYTHLFILTCLWEQEGVNVKDLAQQLCHSRDTPKEAIMASTRSVWHLMALIAIGWLGVGSGLVHAADLPVTRNVELEALQEAVRWPNPTPQTVLALAGQFMANRRDHEGYTFFQERATSQPDQPLLLAPEGLFQARSAGEVPLLQRVAWVNEALVKLDRAVSQGSGLTRYFRGTVLAQLPAEFGKAEAAVVDLEWVLQNQERFPLGFRRNGYRALAQAYTLLGREKEAAAALQRSGYASLDPTLPLFTANSWVTAKEGFRFSPPRFVEFAPKVYVAQGYDFADLAFVLTDDGIVAPAHHAPDPHPRPLGPHRRAGRTAGTRRTGDRPGQVCRRVATRERDRGGLPLLFWRGGTQTL